MPKMKTHRGAAKRFKKTGKGKLKRTSNYRSHLLGHKTTKRKRKLRKTKYLSNGDQKRMIKVIPY